MQEVDYLHATSPHMLEEEKIRSCGDPEWRAWYAHLVQQMREGTRQPNYLVNGHFHTGLSDRLVCFHRP